MNSEQKNSELMHRAIGLPQATAMVCGIIIGASIFVQPSEITGKVPSVFGVFLVWIISGLLTFFGALVCAELASIFTRSGGIYVYLKEAFFPAMGFLWGWAMFWVIHSGIIAAIAVIFARYTAFFIPLSQIGIKISAIILILILSTINYLGVKKGSTLLTVLTMGKVAVIAIIVILGFILGTGLPDHFSPGSLAAADFSLKNFFLALVAGLFAFGGWHMVTYNAEETFNPRRTIPRSLFLGTIIVTLSYIAMNAVYMYILPLDKVASSTRVAADAADALIGYGGGAFMSGLVIFSTIGAVNGIILTGPRVYYAMAKDGFLFHRMGEIHPRFRTPGKAIILQALWSSILVFSGTYKALFTRVIYTEWIFFGLTAIGLMILRKRPDLTREYRIWGYPVVPVIFVLSSFTIVINQIFSSPSDSLWGLSLVLAGLPVYYIWQKISKKEKTS
jgi:APA family basic amino acid/polyamine antiporter